MNLANRSVTPISFWLILPFLLLTASWTLMYPFTVDDAYISYRYVHNVIDGHGLVFNIGERVEGYSNPSWVALLTVGALLGFEVEALSKVLGLLFGLFVIYYADKTASLFGISRGVRLASISTLAITPHLAYYAACGLETTFYVAQVTALACYLLRYERTSVRGDIIKASVATGLAILTRPEAPMLMLPLAIVAYRERHSLRGSLSAVAVPSIVLAGLTIFRYSYFGELLPNTFAAKVNSGAGGLAELGLKLKEFAEYAIESFEYIEFIPVLAVMGALRIGRPLMPVVVVMALIVVFILAANGDWMGLGRFYLPMFPLFFVLAYYAIELMLESQRHAGWRLALPMMLPLALVAFGLVRSAHELRHHYGLHTTMNASRHAELTKYLEQTAPPDAIIAAPEIGRLAFNNHFYVLDMQGLTDKPMARMVQGGDFSNYAEYILSRDPDRVLLYDKERPRDTAIYPLEKQVMRAMETRGDYVLDSIFPLSYFKNCYIYRRTH